MKGNEATNIQYIQYIMSSLYCKRKNPNILKILKEIWKWRSNLKKNDPIQMLYF